VEEEMSLIVPVLKFSIGFLERAITFWIVGMILALAAHYLLKAKPYYVKSFMIGYLVAFVGIVATQLRGTESLPLWAELLIESLLSLALYFAMNGIFRLFGIDLSGHRRATVERAVEDGRV
jgi:hypothetical protein